MRFTKGMKKALSLALSAALVITGVNFTSSAKAAEETGSLEIGTGFNATFNATAIDGWKAFEDATELTITDNGDYEFSGVAPKEITNVATGANIYINTDMNINTATGSAFSMTVKEVKVNDTAVKLVEDKGYAGFEKEDGEYKENGNWQINLSNPWNESQCALGEITLNEGDKLTVTVTVSGMVEKKATPAPTAASTATAGSVNASTHGAATGSTTTAASGATTTAASGSTTTATSAPATQAPVQGNMDSFNVGFNYVADDTWGEQTWGDETVSVTGDGSYSITYEAQSDSEDIFMMILSTDLYKGSLNDKFSLVPTAVQAGSKVYTIKDATGAWGFADQEEDAAYRANIVNPYNGLYAESGVDWVDPTVTSMDLLGTAPVKAGDKISVFFTVAGMNKVNADATAAPSASSTVKKTKSITAAKKSVSLAPGASTTVKYTVKKAAGAKSAQTVSVSSSSKKVATVKKVSGSKVKITANKKAAIGSTAKVTLKSGSKKAVITVKVSKVNVKAKKSAKYTVKLAKVTKKTKAKKIAVKYSKKKIAKVTVKKTAKGQVTVQVKGLKKGTTTVTLKNGKKSAKFTVTVKK